MGLKLPVARRPKTVGHGLSRSLLQALTVIGSRIFLLRILVVAVA